MKQQHATSSYSISIVVLQPSCERLKCRPHKYAVDELERRRVESSLVMLFDSCTDTCGWHAAVVAALAYGSFGVPIKATVRGNIKLSTCLCSTCVSVYRTVLAHLSRVFAFLASEQLKPCYPPVPTTTTVKGVHRRPPFGLPELQDGDDVCYMLACAADGSSTGLDSVGTRFGDSLGPWWDGWRLRHPERGNGHRGRNVGVRHDLRQLRVGDPHLPRTRG